MLDIRGQGVKREKDVKTPNMAKFSALEQAFRSAEKDEKDFISTGALTAILRCVNPDWLPEKVAMFFTDVPLDAAGVVNYRDFLDWVFEDEIPFSNGDNLETDQIQQVISRLEKHLERLNSRSVNFILCKGISLLESIIDEISSSVPDNLEAHLSCWLLGRCTNQSAGSTTDSQSLKQAVSVVKELLNYNPLRSVNTASPRSLTDNELSQPRVRTPSWIQTRTSSVEAAQTNNESSLGHKFRAVSVQHLCRDFLEDVESAGLNASARIYEIEPKVIRPRGANTICPRDGKLGAAYVDCVSEGAGLATIMLSYTWGYTAADIFDGLLEYCRNHQFDKRMIYVWMCCLCINQHRVKEANARGETIPFATFEQEFGDRVQGIGSLVALLSPWRNPLYMARVWCDYEMFTAVQLGERSCRFTITMPRREFVDLRASLLRGSSGMSEVWNAVADVQVQNAEATVPEDKERIFKLIENGPGFHKLNGCLAKFMQSWVVKSSESYLQQRLADESTPVEDVAAMCLCLGQLLKSVGNLQDAATTLSDGMLRCKKAGILETVQGAEIINESAHIKKAWGDIAGALVDYELAWNILKSASAIETTAGVHLMTNMGKLKRERHDVKGAIEVLGQAVKTMEAMGIIETTDGAAVLVVVGACDQDLGDLTAASKQYERARQIYQRMGMMDTPDAAKLLNRMGELQLNQGNTRAALQLLEEALTIREATSTVETPAGAAVVRYIGDAKAELGDSRGALEAFIKALHIRELTGADRNAGAAALFHSLGNAKAKLMDWSGALEAYHSAKEIFETLNELELPNGKRLLQDIATSEEALQRSPPGASRR